MHNVVHISHTKDRQVVVIFYKMVHSTPYFINESVMRVTIYVEKTKLLQAKFIYAHSYDEVVAVVYYSDVYLIVPDKPKATRLALRWNYKCIKGVETIHKRSCFDGRVYSFRDETYLRFS
jgi:hypothetical protein